MTTPDACYIVHTISSSSSHLGSVPLKPRPLSLSLLAHGRHHVGVVRVPEGGVYGGGGGQHVSGVAEGGQVAHGHVSGQGGGAEGRALVVQAFGELLVGVAAALVLFGLVGHLAVPRLDALLLHGQRSVHLRAGRHRERPAAPAPLTPRPPPPGSPLTLCSL